MSTSTFFLLTRGLALAALGAGALLVGNAGCGESVSSLCQKVCACTGCSTTEQEQCEATFNDAQKVSSDKGCTDQYNTYVSCYEGHFQCVGSTIDASACATELSALAKCGGGADVSPGTGGGTSAPKNVSCDIVSSGLHLCTTWGNVTASEATELSSGCTQQDSGTVGTVVTACPTAGLLGVCQEEASNGVTVSETYYSGSGLTAATSEMACEESGGTWTLG